MKRIVSMLLIVMMILSMSCIGVLANDDVPSDLPEGTVKIAEGIYAYTPSDISIFNYIDWTNIGTVPAFGTIIQPNAFSNVIVDNGHNYLRLQCTKEVRINFVRGNQSVFGANLYQWPIIGGGTGQTIYYIEADYYKITRGVPYQLQCTSSTSSPRTNVELTIWSSSGR